MTADSAAVAFRSVFGADPSGVWSAPGRVNLIGEHVDYNAGLVLPMAIPQRTWAACAPRSDGLLRVHSMGLEETVDVSLDDIGPHRPGGWASYVAGVLWSLRQSGYAVGGMDIAVGSGVPLGAGLSSSAALECSVGAAASDLFGLGLLADDEARARLASICVRAENDIALAPTGGMDQAASMRCHRGHALLLDCRDGTVEQVPFILSHADGDHVILVTDTRAEHALVDGQYAARRRSCEEAADLLGVPSLRDIGIDDLDGALAALPDEVLQRRTRHVVTEIERVRLAVAALRSGDLAEVGRLFDASHASLRDDFEVSAPELDASVEAAKQAGALGARMTGGGFGGSSIALLRSTQVPAAVEAITAAFAARGWTAPVSFVVEPSDGAHRDA